MAAASSWCSELLVRSRLAGARDASKAELFGPVTCHRPESKGPVDPGVGFV